MWIFIPILVMHVVVDKQVDGTYYLFSKILLSNSHLSGWTEKKNCSTANPRNRRSHRETITLSHSFFTCSSQYSTGNRNATLGQCCNTPVSDIQQILLFRHHSLFTLIRSDASQSRTPQDTHQKRHTSSGSMQTTPPLPHGFLQLILVHLRRQDEHYTPKDRRNKRHHIAPQIQPRMI